MKTLFYLSICLTVLLITGQAGNAGDLDDGISKYTDDSIAKWDEMGKADKNIKFIVLNAKSKATLGNEPGKKTGGTGKTGDANMNSVVMGPGSNVRGDIIIIDQSKGSKTNIAQ